MSNWPTTIVQEDINAYAEVSGDFNRIHVDPEFARTTPYGGTIAHGCIAGAIVTRYLVQDLALGPRFRGLSLKFVNAVRSGDSLHCTAQAPPQDATTVEVVCRNQREETVAIGTAKLSATIGRDQHGHA